MRLMTTEISLEYERLWEVGTEHLPLLAGDLHEAGNDVKSAAIGHAFEGFLYQTTGDKWYEACRGLEEVLWYTREAVTDAAKAVCDVVNGYAATDQAAADAVARSQSTTD